MRRLAFLSILLILGAGYLLYVDRRVPEDAEVAPQTILGVDQIDQMAEVRVERGKQRYVVVRGEHGWQFSEPEGLDLDQQKIQALLKAFISVQALNTTDSDTDRESTGLNDPALEVLVKTAAGAEQKLVFGRAHAFSGRRYLETPKGVVLIDETAFRMLDRSYTDLRDERVLAGVGSFETLRSLELERADSRLTFTREPNGRWLLLEERPGGTNIGGIAVDPPSIQELLGRLESMQSSGFIDRPAALSEYGLDKPAITATLTVADQRQPLKIYLGRIKGGTPTKEELVRGEESYALRSDRITVFHLAKRIPSDFFRSADEFRVRQPFADLAVSDPSTISIEGTDIPRFAPEPSSPAWNEIFGLLQKFEVITYAQLSEAQVEQALSQPEAVIRFRLAKSPELPESVIMIGNRIAGDDTPDRPFYGAVRGIDGYFSPVVVRSEQANALVAALKKIHEMYAAKDS